MVKFFLFLSGIFLVFLSSGQSTATLKGDTLFLSNSLIERKFIWNNGELISASLKDKTTGQNILDVSAAPAFDFIKEVKNATFDARKVDANSIHPAALEAEILIDYGPFKLKRLFRIHDNVPAVSCSYYLWIDSDEDIQNLKKQLENTVSLENLKLSDNHPHYTAVEFFDQTDVHNNLVRKTEVLPFGAPVELRGNVLQISFPGSPGNGIFILKEAPCSSAQLDYPGYDFKIHRNRVSADGIGFSPENIITDEWVNLYGAVTGCFDGTELGLMKALRTYQKSLRKMITERDDMIMMNTWGDRNRDASINEEFLKGELDACEKLGITHFQIDDGWQQGLSHNSANAQGEKWEFWQEEDWQPHQERLPNGFDPIVKYAAEKGIQLGLWFNPSMHNSFEHWERDANIVLGLYEKYGIRYFKIDGVQIPDKLADHRLHLFFEKLAAGSNGKIVPTLDVTAGRRTGYHYRNIYGTIFLENRYTDWQNYYPHWTLRNLWQLSAYVPPEKLQIEFLNKWRNEDKYEKNDPLAPAAIPFDYQFAITMMAQPLAWFEGTGLPEEAFEIAPLIKKYETIQTELHSGHIFPIGEEPGGFGWTGFQSIVDDKTGYLLIFRENNENSSNSVATWLPENSQVRLTPVLGKASAEHETKTNGSGEIIFQLPEKNSFGLYKYEILNQ